jgi:uncharacterized membrane protein
VSAVIYAAIVVMWAVVLVPMWLRRHDAATESRSVDRFSTAMRILSRRSSGGPDRRYVVMPRREESVSVHVSGAAAPRRPVRTARTARPTVATTSIVVRRRRLFLGLAGVAGLTLLLAAGGVLTWVLQILVDLVLVAFVVHLRAQARRAAVVSRQRRRVTAAPAARAERPVPTARPAVAPPAASSRAARLDPSTEPPAEVQYAYAAATAGDAESTWQPIPVPPPTYTLKPPAPAPAMPVQAPAAQVARDPDPFDQEAFDGDDRDSALDEILEHRWAVND